MRQPLGVGMPTAHRSASGSSAMATSASTSRGQREQQIGRAGLLRVRERDGREVGVGANCSATVWTSVMPASRSASHGDLAADAVHRRQCHPHVTRCVRARLPRRARAT